MVNTGALQGEWSGPAIDPATAGLMKPVMRLAGWSALRLRRDADPEDPETCVRRQSPTHSTDCR